MRVNGNLVLNDNASGELRHVYIERLDNAAETTAAGLLTAAHKGRLIFNTTTSQYKYWDGSVFQVLANGATTGTVQAELDALEAALGTAINSDGTFNVAALSALTKINVTGSTTLTDVLFDIDQAIANIDVSSQIAPIQAEIDAIETASGLNTDGTLPAYTGANYISTATSLRQATTQLDTQVKTNADGVAALQAEVDAVEVGAGLAADGTYAADATTNYLTAATSLKDADKKLDAQVKVNADGIATLNTTVAGKQDSLGYVPVNKAGDSMSGNLVMQAGTNVVVNDAPTAGTHAVNKNYVDSTVAGLKWKNSVKAASTAAIANLAGDQQAGISYIQDGVALVTGNRFLVKDGASVDGVAAVSAINNGIYTVSVSTTGEVGSEVTTAVFTRATDADAIAELASAAVFVEQGTALADVGFTCTTDSAAVLGTDDIAFAQFNGAANITAGNGLSKSGNTLFVNMGAGISQLPTDEVGVDLLVAGALMLTVDGSTDSTDTAAQLAVRVDGTTLTRSATGVKVSAGGITATELAAGTAGSGLTGGAGAALAVGAGTGIVVTADAVAFDETYGDARYINVTGDTMTGTLALAGNAVAALDAVPKQQLDTAVSAVDADIAAIVASLNKTHYVHAYTNTGATAAITVVHNLGVKYCNVTVVDATDEVFIPQSITFVDVNTLTVTLNTDISGNVVVTGHATLTL